MKIARLILEDGSQFVGWSFGYDTNTAGEVVFNTAMTGYPESLTDPSYAGQILVTTYPLIGNYGVPDTGLGDNGLPLFMESEKIHAKALVVADYSETYSHWNARESLASWLKREKTPAITGIDTRRLTKVLRESGVMMGKIVVSDHSEYSEDSEYSEKDYGSVNWVEKVSCKEVITYQPEGEKKHRVVLVDCGVKNNIIRCLLKRGVEVIRVPWNYDFSDIQYDGLFLANGPGDPDTAIETVHHIQKAMNQHPSRPIFGICMGNQLLAKAGGAKTYKLKYGHRSHNQPVQEVGTNRCFITSQNHGYAVDSSTLGKDWVPYFINMNDNSNEGIRHKYRPWFSVQFHPEACSGPTDTEYLFDDFVKIL
jgi:carbamoyl-phosphate synthase small subunit